MNNLNIAEGQYHDAVEKNDIGTAIALQSGIKFNGGGHINHSIFWTNLAPTKLGGGSLQQGVAVGQGMHGAALLGAAMVVYYLDS